MSFMVKLLTSALPCRRTSIAPVMIGELHHDAVAARCAAPAECIAPDAVRCGTPEKLAGRTSTIGMFGMAPDVNPLEIDFQFVGKCGNALRQLTAVTLCPAAGCVLVRNVTTLVDGSTAKSSRSHA